MAIALRRSHLDQLEQDVAVPDYDPSAATASIVHLGVGGFHRAHQAMYIDALLRRGVTDWAICGIGVRPEDAAMRDALATQDQLYTLATVAPDGTGEARIIGSIVEYVFAPDDPAAAVARIASDTTRIVELTITEGGYSVDDATGAFSPTDPDVLADAKDLSAPRSALGLIVAGLRARRDAGATPFTVLSCDNIPGNGKVARTAVLGLAEQVDPELAAWIAAEVAFPSTMVDRITPATTNATRQLIAEQYGIEDLWPVRSESFAQWVVEDHFTQGRPPLEDVGVQVVEDVEPYELMKLRLLNASHQALGHLGMLMLGPRYVHEACRDDAIGPFLWRYWRTEAIPTLGEVPGIDLEEYCAELVARFSSDEVADTLERLVTDASDRIPKFLLPVISSRLRSGAKITASVTVLAAWELALEGRAETGEATSMPDRRADLLQQAVAAEQKTPGAFLDVEEIFGDLGSNVRVRRDFIAARESLEDRGVEGTLEAMDPELGL